MRHRDGPPAVGRALAALAASQHGVVCVSQLRALGLDSSAVHRRVAAARLHPLHRGVHAVGHRALTPRARYLAAVLACGPEAALSHRSAASLWDLRPPTARLEVTVPRGRAGARGIALHRSRSLIAEEVVLRYGIPVTSVARTLVDLAGVVGSQALARALDRSERLRLFDLELVHDTLARSNGRRGAAALRRAIADWRPRESRSELEDRFQDLLSGADGLPIAGFNVVVTGERDPHEVDALWAPERLAVELDGFAYHRTRRDRECDAARDADLELAGYRVLRLTWDDVAVHRERTLRRLRRLLAEAP